MNETAQALKCKLGVVSTGNSLDLVEADDALMADNGERVVVVGFRGFD